MCSKTVRNIAEKNYKTFISNLRSMITINPIYFRFLWKYVQHLIIKHYCTCIEYQKSSCCL